MLASAAFFLRCSSQHALLLTIRATTRADSFDLRVKDTHSGKVVLERVGEPVDPVRQNRDISKPGEVLKIAVEFSRPGSYLVYIRGRKGQAEENAQFALRDFQVDGVREAAMLLVPLVDDGDLDGYPACGTGSVNCAQIACPFLDCDDGDALVHPFAAEVCGNGKDDDCSALCGADPAEGDAQCVDDDGDGVPTPRDCDDSDPCRSPDLREEQNLCQVKAEEFPQLSQACIDKLKSEGKSPEPPFCNDGVDQDCNGQDVACVTDEDCDGFSPPADCDDTKPEINRKAKELCGDGVDNNCNGVKDEGCVPCDVDGDGHALPDVTDPECKDKLSNEPLPRDDGDDYDAGIHPNATTDTEGKEGGHALAALRQYCSYELDKRGKRHRDVDHDGDGSVANADGCPDEHCDLDGDGFEGAQCSPPASMEDCNDGDATVFPGAPDYCGDGIKQNCISESACTDDPDNDHYQGKEDCNPDRADVHPWAKELCNGIDDDCDGHVDEGNPGMDGTPIRVDAKLCNDDNDGICGGGGPMTSQVCTPGSPGCSSAGRKLSGDCACSKIEPNATRDPMGNRVACPGEDLSKEASPRCFRAIPPEVEQCDPEDWDCNGKPDDPSGENPMVDQGKICGTSVGNCITGTVIGCDLSATPPELALIQQVLAAQQIEFNPHWVCEPTSGQPGVWLPTQEVCNGKDDDCDGVVPDPEKDPDSDKFLACAGCTTGGGRTDLASGLTGCGDCGPTAPSIYPGAREDCNGIDDNCVNGPSVLVPFASSDDGQDECTGGLTCCPDTECRNLLTEIGNCGSCGNVCVGSVADSCVNGSCVCGSGTAPCGPGLNCQGGACQCIAGGRCTGCCEGTAACRGGNLVTVCGTGGAQCQSCVDGNECTQDLCQGGACSNPDEPRSTTCSGGTGRCFRNAGAPAATCCTGCTSAGVCHTENSATYCGLGGASDCVTCTADLCQAATCLPSGSCSLPFPASPPTVCRPAAGVCDVAEVCDGSNPSCPTDVFLSGTVCRAAAAEPTCDVSEACSGSVATCPTDGFKTAGTVCRTAAPDPTCELPALCSGTSATCPAKPLKTAGTVCRPAVGECDKAETCSGTSATCPADVDEPDNTSCSGGVCCGGECRVACCGGVGCDAACCNGSCCTGGTSCCGGSACCALADCCDGTCCTGGTSCCGGTTCCDPAKCCGSTCCNGPNQCCDSSTTCVDVNQGQDELCGIDGEACTFCAAPDYSCNPDSGDCDPT